MPSTERAAGKAVGALLGPERRFTTIEADPETRADDDGALRFRGHAAVFDTRTFIGQKPWGFWEEIRSGAFAKTIGESDIRFLHNHDPNLALARSTIAEGPGSLRLAEDRKGLLTRAEWIQTTFARDLHETVRAGVVDQMSFAFWPVREEWSKNENDEDVRSLLEVRVDDVSTVTFPAYTETDAAVRSAGLGLLMDAAGLDDDHRVAILDAVRQGYVTPDFLPAVRAASRALAELAAAHAPAEATRETDKPSGDEVRAQQIELRFRALMARSGEYRSTT